MTTSPTQPSVSEEDIKRIVAEGLGAGLVTAEPLTGGTFAVVWRAELDDGRSVVVKVGPPASARLLRYEKDVIPAEAEYYTTVRAHAPDVPVPTVLAVSADPPWIIATMLPGEPLTAKDSPRARRELGATLAKVHTITGPHF